MSTAPSIPEKARRLVPMLGSPADGEVLNAARAIGRVLGGAGLGFVDLAQAIPAHQEVRHPKVVRPQSGPFERRRSGSIPEFSMYAFRRAYTPRQEAEHRARVRFCQEQPWRLTAWERSFIENVARLCGNLSIRQGDHLARIVDRLEGEARRA